MKTYDRDLSDRPHMTTCNQTCLHIMLQITVSPLCTLCYVMDVIKVFFS